MAESRPVGLEDLTDFDIAWPEHSDTLKSGVGGKGSIAVGSVYGTEYRLISGYREAALLLAARIQEGGSFDESLFFPYAHCWRHHVELQLKMLIQDSAKLYGEPAPGDLVSTHSLHKLWNHAKTYIERTFPNDQSADTRVPERIITQLSMIDPGGIAFRYAKTVTGERALVGLSWVDMQPFHQALINLSSYFNGALEGTAWLQDQQPDEGDFI